MIIPGREEWNEAIRGHKGGAVCTDPSNREDGCVSLNTGCLRVSETGTTNEMLTIPHNIPHFHGWNHLCWLKFCIDDPCLVFCYVIASLHFCSNWMMLPVRLLNMSTSNKICYTFRRLSLSTNCIEKIANLNGLSKYHYIMFHVILWNKVIIFHVCQRGWYWHWHLLFLGHMCLPFPSTLHAPAFSANHSSFSYSRCSMLTHHSTALLLLLN